ncbi:bifunctional phosphatase PAP2/diacylglycerol kinase family protein [Arthrobacter sp. M4]|uniref:bifunctional phosphatase PAP2/diacylglycerol kinase family protein n=1 Tax=Arthrobacter sp. M4 TaxID=218160 RepID=UPI001CDCA338|nr:bifunctional phosphatase PAP2/diacylglycerol kinase family protein [Arthrobacter sp. M4]MCA4133258.1 phosphatase PAP2 family protein [Arthrobacter sp. M4]
MSSRQFRRLLWHKGPGRIAAMDRTLVRVVSRLPHGAHDGFFRELSAAATKGKLWFAAAGLLAVIPGRPRRAALHGVLALGVASAVTNIVFKTLLPRARPLPEHLPVFRFVHPQPTSSSLPSGHSASAVAFALGAGMVHPGVGLALAPVAAGVAYSRVHTGAHWPSDVLFGSAIGASAALLTRHWWPVKPEVPEPRRTPARAPELPDGAGLAIVVNEKGGSYTPETTTTLQEAFPKAHIFEISDGQDVAAEIGKAAGSGARALGVWGGDGTVGTAAAAAVEHSLPLLVLPGGTLNHFARDVSIDSVETAATVAALGQAVQLDLGHVLVERGLVDSPESLSLTMLNTASIGVYPNLVRRREHLTAALGKPLAGVVAGLRTFGASTPTHVKINGVRHKIWILYLGRGRYYPRDLAPLVRPVLDDGLLDIRMVTADEPFARVRLLWAVLTGTAGSSKVTHLREADSLVVEADNQSLVLAVDGEPLPGVRRAEFTVRRSALVCYAPHSVL